MGRVFFVLAQIALWHLQQSRIFLNLRTGPTGHATLFNRCVYQQTNQNIAPVIKNFQNNGRSRTESVIVSRLSGIFLRLFMMRLVKYSAHFVAYFFFYLLNNWSVFKVGEQVSIIFSIHRFFTKF